MYTVQDFWSKPDTIENYRQYPQFGILLPIGDLKSPIGYNIANLGLAIYEFGSAESYNKSPIPNWIKYHQLEIWNTQLCILYPIGDIITNWVFSSVSPLMQCIGMP